MKVAVSGERLKAALSVVSRGTAKRNTLPVLANVLAEVENGALRLTATDLDTTISTTVEGDVVADGQVSIPALMLTDLVGKLGVGDVVIELPDGATMVKVYKLAEGKRVSSYEIMAMPAEDFPVTSNDFEGPFVTMPQHVLRTMLHSVLFATSKEENRTILQGALIEAVPGKNGAQLRAVATDTHRLAFRGTSLASEVVAEKISVNVPGKVLADIEKFLASSGEQAVTMRLDKSEASRVRFEINQGDNQLVIISNLLMGQFPNYEKVIPEKSDRTVTIDRKDWLNALKRMKIIGEKATMEFAASSVDMVSEQEGVGTGKESVQVHLDGVPIKIALNAKYMMDVLSLLESETVDLKCSDPMKPVTVTCADAPGFKYVLMPMAN